MADDHTTSLELCPFCGCGGVPLFAPNLGYAGCLSCGAMAPMEAWNRVSILTRQPQSLSTSLSDALANLPTNFELSWGELDGDRSECVWRIHSVNGGYNDREWALVAIGETPAEAILAAMKSKEQSND